MNDHSGGSLQNANLSPFGQRGGLPSTGLRDLVVPVPVVAQGQKSVSLAEIWRVIAKWWWLIAGIVVACVLAAFAISSMIQPVYLATTTIEVNREGTPAVQVGEVPQLQMQDREFLNTQSACSRAASWRSASRGG
jgi:uncharacterized protein involved in exopolysaccharide biosynthesis